MIAARIVPPTDAPLLDVARQAKAEGCRLYITREGNVVTFPRRMPGWQPIGVGIDPAPKEKAA